MQRHTVIFAKFKAGIDKKSRHKVSGLALSRENKAAFNLCKQTDRDTQTALMRSSKASYWSDGRQ